MLPTEGTVDNLARVRSGDADMGLALADVVAERDLVTGPAAIAPVAVAVVYENYLQVIVRVVTKAHDIADLQGRRISIGAARSGGAISSRVLFDAAGLSGRVDMLSFRLRDALARLDRRPGRRTATADTRHRRDEPDRRLSLRRPGARVRVCAAAHLVPPYVRGLQYLDTPR